MAVFGEIVLLFVGCALAAIGLAASATMYAMSGNRDSFWALVWTPIGVAIVWVAVHYGPITIAINLAL